MGPKCNHMDPYKREADGSESGTESQRCDDGNKGGSGVEPCAKGCRQPLETGKRQGGGFSPRPPRRNQSCGHLDV